MARNLNWFQARDLSRATNPGRPIRREAWRRWIAFNWTSYLWHHDQPYIQADEANPAVPAAQHVVKNLNFVAADFFANDWTDEHWDAEPDPCPYPYYYDATTKKCVPIIQPPGGGGPIDPPGTTPPSGGGGGGTTPPDDSTDPGPGTGTGPGGGSGGGSGGGGSGGGGNGGGTVPPNNKPPQPPKPEADYTPTVELTLDPGFIDGPGCYINVPEKGSASVNVSLPSPNNGTLKVATISVTCGGQTKVGTLGPGAGQGFQFNDIPINPGGTLTATATASDGNGHTWTGSDDEPWPRNCLIITGTWSGSQTITVDCNPPGDYPPNHGSTTEKKYTTTKQYAVDPKPAGTKTANDTGVQYEHPNGTIKVTSNPDGSVTNSTFDVPAPGSIGVTIDADGNYSNITPAKLGVFPDSANGSTTEGDCTTTTTGSESGPSGS